MSGVGEFLFGDEGEPAQIIEAAPAPFPELRAPVSNVFRGLLEGRAPTLAGIPRFEGPLVAGLSPDEQALVSLIGERATSGNPLFGASQDLLQQTLGGKFLTPGSNPFLQQAIEAATRPVIEQFERQIIPNLRSQFTAAGQLVQPGGSSPFDKAAGQAQTDFLRTIGDISSKISFGNFQQERTRQQHAVTQGLQLTQAQLDQSVESLRAVALPRLVEQLGIDRGLEEFNRRVGLLLDALQMAGSLGAKQPIIRGLPGTEGTTGFFGQLLGAGATAGGTALGTAGGNALAAALSDRRLKRDIRKIGVHPNGLNMYRYRFLWEERERTGFMADEVAEVRPDAVIVTPSGYLAVDYGRLL